MNVYQLFGKRLIDLLVSLLALIFFFPVILLVLLILLIGHRRNPVFFQHRPGKNGKIFRLIKFKTMTDEKDAQGNLLPDEMRLTPLGKFVRKTSLDELPQLINVIKGDMSLIGPRPLLVSYLSLYTPAQNRRHHVRPGITGWAQVNGRNAISWEQKFDMDVWYVDHIGLTTDLRILVLTIKKVFKTEGISSNGHATMPTFKGSPIS